MASDIPGYGARDALPWNPDSGKPIGPFGSEELSYATDLRRDPADNDDNYLPQTGWKDGLKIGGSGGS